MPLHFPNPFAQPLHNIVAPERICKNILTTNKPSNRDFFYNYKGIVSRENVTSNFLASKCEYNLKNDYFWKYNVIY